MRAKSGAGAGVGWGWRGEADLVRGHSLCQSPRQAEGMACWKKGEPGSAVSKGEWGQDDRRWGGQVTQGSASHLK